MMKSARTLPSIHIPIQDVNGSVGWAWYMFFQWVSENVGSVDLSDYFTKEETEELLSAKANIDDLSDVAFSGDYDDLSNKPTIPTVNNATLTIQKNGTTVETFTANASSDVTANITVPTKISDLTNDSNFANTDLSNLTSTGKANVSAQGTYDSGATYSAGTVGEAIQNKANVALDNLTSTGKEVCANMPMPSNRFADLTLGASGNTYTMPADGYLTFGKNATAVGQYLLLRNNSSASLEVVNKSPNPSGYIQSYIVAKKGDSIRVEYNLAGSTRLFRFIYANGAQ